MGKGEWPLTLGAAQRTVARQLGAVGKRARDKRKLDGAESEK